MTKLSTKLASKIIGFLPKKKRPKIYKNVQDPVRGTIPKVKAWYEEDRGYNKSIQDCKTALSGLRVDKQAILQILCSCKINANRKTSCNAINCMIEGEKCAKFIPRMVKVNAIADNIGELIVKEAK